MKAQLLTALTTVVCLTAQAFGQNAPQAAEELPASGRQTATEAPCGGVGCDAVGCCDMGGRIVIYRKVYLNETLPELGARLYDRVDYELKLRKLDQDIRIAQAELENGRERARVYNKHFGRTSALFVTRQNAQLDVLKSEQQLKLLRQEKLLALRYRSDQVRYRKLLLAENAARLQLEE